MQSSLSVGKPILVPNAEGYDSVCVYHFENVVRKPTPAPEQKADDPQAAQTIAPRPALTISNVKMDVPTTPAPTAQSTGQLSREQIDALQKCVESLQSLLATLRPTESQTTEPANY